MSNYTQSNPIPLLVGNVSSVGIEAYYPVDDNSGLGPNSSNNIPIRFSITASVNTQDVGTLIAGASSAKYDGLDIKAGFWLANQAGTICLKVLQVVTKAPNSITVLAEDVDAFSYKNNQINQFTSGQSCAFFRLSDSGMPQISGENAVAHFTDAMAILKLQARFSIQQNLERLRLEFSSSQNIEEGQIVVLNSSKDALVPYGTPDAQTFKLGVVLELAFDKTVVFIKPFNKIIERFIKPNLLQGSAGSTYYTDALGGITTTSGGDELFYQLTDATPTVIEADTLDVSMSSADTLNINGISCVSGAATIDQIVTAIEDPAKKDLHFVTATSPLGVTELKSFDNGANASNNDVLLVVSNDSGSTFTYPSITVSDGSAAPLSVTLQSSNTLPFPSSNQFLTLTASEIATILNTAFTNAGLGIIASTFSHNSGNNSTTYPGLKLTLDPASSATQIAITNVTNDVFDNSFTASLAISPNTIQKVTGKRLTLTRADGGDILLTGAGSFVNSNGLTSSSSGSPPILALAESKGPQGIQGESGQDADNALITTNLENSSTLLSSLATSSTLQSSLTTSLKNDQDFQTSVKGDTGSAGPVGPVGPAGTGISFKGVKNTSADLPSVGNSQGDAYIVQASDSLYIYSTEQSAWVDGGSIQGPQGLPGLSAFEVWQQSNPLGTQAEFLAYLVGSQGDKGDQGDSITAVSLSSDYELLIDIENQSQINLGSIRGPEGQQGPPGTNGQNGADGADGADGAAATISVGTVTSLEPDDTPTVTNSGNNLNATFNFGIPKGQKGDDGNQGPQGESITAVTLNNYELLVTIGSNDPVNLGSVRGPQGDQGDKGDKGDTGETGQTGAQGPTGLQGPAGTGITFRGSVAADPSGSGDVTLVEGGTFTPAQGDAVLSQNEDKLFIYGTSGWADGGSIQGPQGVQGQQGQQGPKGDTGDSITAVTLNASHELLITIGSNSATNVGSVRGPQGETGPTGTSITGVTNNGNGTLTIAFSDGTNHTTDSLKGDTGETGDTGPAGPTGPAGTNADSYIDDSSTANDRLWSAAKISTQLDLKADIADIPTSNAGLANGAGYITSVSESHVTAHQAALSITESQISDFGTYETADSTILRDANIGSTVQAYDSEYAALKTKVGTIETNAKDDQTAQEIVSLIDADSTAETALKSALGLASAAYTESTAYATAAQGTKADNAVPKDSSVASSTSNTGRQYIQNITLNSDGLVTNITSAEETVTNTNTTYSAASDGGLSLSNEEFSIANSVTAATLNDAAKTVNLTFDAHGLITAATLQDIAIAQSQVSGLGTALDAKQSNLDFGISDTNAVKIDSDTIALGEYARFTSDGLESLSAAELKSALSLPADTGSSITSIESSIGTATLGTTANDLKSAVNELHTELNTNTSNIGSNTSNIGTNTSNISTNASNISSNDTDISNLQSLADTHESSIGLEADGSYAAISGANYASSSSSLKAAVAQLDTQLKTTQNEVDAEETARASAISTVNSSISTLQSEVDATQTAVGLATDGTYSAISEANYADSSSSLKAAVKQLDTQLKATQDDLETAEAAIVSNDTDIATNVSAINTIESSVGLSASGAYQAPSSSNYLSSASSVRDADSKLDAQIKTNADAIDVLEIRDGGLILQTDDKGIHMPQAITLSSHTGPFRVDFAQAVANNGEADLIFYGTKAKTHEDKFFTIDTTTGDASFTG